MRTPDCGSERIAFVLNDEGGSREGPAFFRLSTVSGCRGPLLPDADNHLPPRVALAEMAEGRGYIPRGVDAVDEGGDGERGDHGDHGDHGYQRLFPFSALPIGHGRQVLKDIPLENGAELLGLLEQWTMGGLVKCIESLERGIERLVVLFRHLV
jgi:hypothetical protein